MNETHIRTNASRIFQLVFLTIIYIICYSRPSELLSGIMFILLLSVCWGYQDLLEDAAKLNEELRFALDCSEK